MATALLSNTQDDAARAERRAASIAAGWTYFHSGTLGPECAVKQTPYGPRMTTEDRVEYMPSELKALAAIGSDVPRAVHEIKRIFDVEVIRWDE